jgi:hydrogenase maturation protease
MWQDAELAIVVDAVLGSPPHPGRIHRLALGRTGSERAASSHGMDLGEAVELARQLGRLPKRMVLFAVEVADVRPGVGLSAEVAAGAERLAEEIAVVVWAANRARPAAVT